MSSQSRWTPDIVSNSQPNPEVSSRNRGNDEFSSEDLLASTDFLNTNQEQEESQQQEEELTVKEVIKRMQNAWINEKFAPCLLEPKTQLVECLLDQMKQMENNLNQIAKTDFRIPIHKMELARIKFVLTSYLRLRLEKIQKFIHVLNLNDPKKTLSPSEQQFAKNYKETLNKHFNTLALRHMPGDFGKLPDPRKADPKLPHPNLDSAVFVSVLRSEDGVLIEDDANLERDTEIDIRQGEQLLLKYKNVSDLVQDGTVRLM